MPVNEIIIVIVGVDIVYYIISATLSSQLSGSPGDDLQAAFIDESDLMISNQDVVQL